MKKLVFLCGLLLLVAGRLCAQSWTAKDSLQLKKLLESPGEIVINRDVLKEVEDDRLYGTPQLSTDKPWLEFDNTLPGVTDTPEQKNKVVLTLMPYTANTRYDWDPVRRRKIKIDKNTWRSDPFYEMKSLYIYTNWAKTPLDKGPRNTVEQIEATGLRYRVTERANGVAVGSWQRSDWGGGIMSGDLMKLFTKDFWNRRAMKNRKRTLEVLRMYGDSISVMQR